MNPRTSWTDADLDAVLSAYLGAGPGAPPDRVAERALREVASTPQEGARLARLASAVAGTPSATWAAVVIVLAIAIGLFLALRPVGGPEPSPSPTPEASRLVLFSSESDGYQLLVPATWAAVPSEYADTRQWVGPDGELMISYGTSILDGGEVTQCGPPTPEWPLCSTQSYPYSIPFDPEVDGVGPLALDGFVRDRCLGGCNVTTQDTELGGEAAELNLTLAADLRATFVSTFHQRRPIIVYWNEPASGPDGAAQIELMRASFRFLDAPGPSPTPFLDPTELVPFVNTTLGYEMLVPRFWGDGADDASHADVHEFGAGRGGGTREDPALTISIGAPDGTVTLCQGMGHQCATAGATTLDELEALLVSIPADFADGMPPEEAGDLVLGGAAGRYLRPGYRAGPATPNEFGIGGNIAGNCLGCPGMLYHAFTLVDGRPIVVSIDWWTIAFDELPPDYIGEMLASFRLLP